MDGSQKQSREGKTLDIKDTYCMILLIRCSKQANIVCNRNQNSAVCGRKGIRKVLGGVNTHTVHLVLYILYSLFGVFVTKVYTFVKIQKTII